MSLRTKREAVPAEQLLAEALEAVKRTAFVPGYQASDAEALGILIARFLKWTGDDIYEAAYNAFEDANYHTFNERFRAAWEAEA